MLTDHDYNTLLKPGQLKVSVRDRGRLIGDPHVCTSITEAMLKARSDIVDYLQVDEQDERNMPWPVEQ